MNLSILNPFGSKPPEGAKSHIRNLMDMAIADGEFCEAEKQLLRQIAKRNKVPESVLKEIERDAKNVVFEVPRNEDQKFYQLYDLVNMMIADKKIHIEERKLCDLLANKFGFASEKVKDIVDAVRLNIENGNDAAETMKRLSFLLR